MKIGITLSNYYKEYLQEIANLNGMSITSICGLIVDNFLSFNKNKERYPIFQKNVSLVFASKHHPENESDVPEIDLSDDDTQRVLHTNWLDED